MAILSNGKFYGFLCSAKETGQKLTNGVKEYVEDFVSGFAGHGWKIWKTIGGFFRLEIDELVVRRTMTVFELLIQKIRAVKGAIAITQANGKIKTVELTEDETAYLITLEENDMSFVEHDYFRCQEFNGSQKFYHVEIESISEGVIRVSASDFTSSTPGPGDEIIQFGNSSHDEQYSGRHSAIYLHADESGQPAIDVMFDIYSKEWEGCVKVRVGGDIPGTNGLKGFYCENGMIKCADKSGTTLYQLNPDGSGFLAKGNIEWDKNGNGNIFNNAMYWDEEGFHLSSGIKIDWDMIEGSPDWINQWTKEGTTIGDKFVASPTGFFGSKDKDERLTGILMGKNVSVKKENANGEMVEEARTGIFALVDDKVIFELDPISKKYRFTGEIESTSGKIGGFDIDLFSLENKNNQEASIIIKTKESLGYDNKGVEKFHRAEASLGNNLPTEAGYGINAVFTSSGERFEENIAMYAGASGSTMPYMLLGGNANLAIKADGGTDWNMKSGDHWCMPGFLGCLACDGNMGNAQLWGNGIFMNKGTHVGVGRYTIKHDLGHTEYMVIVQTTPWSNDGSDAWTTGMECGRYTDHFDIQTIDTTRGLRNIDFRVFVFGRPANK